MPYLPHGTVDDACTKLAVHEHDAVLDRVEHRLELAQHAVLAGDGLGELVLLALELAHVGEDRDRPAVARRALADLNPAAIGPRLKLWP